MNCGESLKPEARFCAGCGAATESEVTRIASRTATPVPASPPLPRPPMREEVLRPTQHDNAEQVVFTARPTLLFIKLGYAAAALGAVLLIFLLALIPQLPAFVSIPLALALLLIPALYHIRRNTIRYTLTDSKIEIDHGLIGRTTRNIPLRNIQDVTVSTTVLQRLLGFGDLVIDNANEGGGPTLLRGIPDPRRHADLLLRELRRWR